MSGVFPVLVWGLTLVDLLLLLAPLVIVPLGLSLPRLRGRAGWGHLPLARWLLWISAAGVVVPMLLGVDYAISRVFPIRPSICVRWR